LAFYIKNIYIVSHAHFLKKIKGYFSGYEMGMGDIYIFKDRLINTLQIIVFSVKGLQRLQLVRAGILFNMRSYCSSNNKTPLLNKRNEA